MAFTAIPLDVPKNKGAVLIGGLASSMLSGFVYVQVVVYFKVYSSDMWQIKAVVASILFLDIVHSVFIWLVLWNYFITDFGLPDGVQDGHWEIGVIFIVTGILIFLAHLFHSHRLFRLAKNKYLLTVPIVVIASVRLVLSIVGGAQLLRFQTIFRWRTDVGWIFTTSLVLSAAVDVLLTISLISILCLKKRGTPSLNAIVDLLMRYAFETACVTCAGSLSSVFCWALMPRNLIFLGLYFVVAKLYSNSLLSTYGLFLDRPQYF
ncbi:hypothetical protein CPB84DRAFT_1229658 [Gymnopilus junonius]|uniref:DUF6534 domain-containing protein n=1 Tax=Gymnopilus junonius TaxID=109634 RepID=A0A9P5P0F2_GYMJU|nr:hypothetical protein CPB84DRAFT_1229658 [Gymnopilus junonius]